ncbi:tetratricopeptide repeat-containing sensor histidine kinase [Salegentibacter mishustinae]|uniref:tetratricopeptide repeat-containing sensor histidine kinase n=1 Tax=Salegentibacter mishustinae TaxID=270918 RepID=UPI000A76A5D0|nr:histidine kinase dimerization/phosphoacceptor domain -containing protein [Salegentibacter mishustinae]PZX65015.1 two-component sensor histidine kinase [Salegentibacter mishustinae]
MKIISAIVLVCNFSGFNFSQDQIPAIKKEPGTFKRILKTAPATTLTKIHQSLVHYNSHNGLSIVHLPTGRAMINSFKSFIWCIALLLCTNGFAQSSLVKKNDKPVVEISVHQNLSSDEVLALSRTYQGKALWFKEMPHFNRDSTVYYFDKAALLLQNSKPLQYKRLAELYRDITDRANRSHNFNIVDSLAPIGWAYYEKIPENNKDKVLGYELLINWALIKIIRGEPKPGLELFVKALDLLKDDKRPEIQLKILKDKGRFYYQYGLPEEEEIAIQYIKKSIIGYENSDYPEKQEALVTAYKVLTYYYEESNPDSTDYYMNQFQELLPQITNPFHHTWYYYSMGNHLINRKKYEEAKSYLIETIQVLEKYNLTTIDIYQFAHSRIGDIAREEGRYDEAISYYEKARNSSIAINTKANTAYFIQKLFNVYELKEDYKTALNYYKEWSEANNIIEVERNERSLRESELQVNVLKQDKELAANQQKQTIYTVALIIGALLLALLYRNYRLKQSSNQKLRALNGELAEKNILLDQRNAENELLLKEIHHRVKNNLEMVKSLIALQSAQIDDPATKDAMIASQNRVQSMGIIHQKLYQGTNLGSIEMKDYFLNLGEGILDSFNAEDRVKIECAMDNLELDIDTAVPIGLIVNELLTNALKYAFPKQQQGVINISLEKSSNQNLRLEVTDNGVGKTAGLAPRGTGFGSQLVQLLTLQLNGKMREHNDKGTHIEFDFMIQKSA